MKLTFRQSWVVLSHDLWCRQAFPFVPNSRQHQTLRFLHTLPSRNIPQDKRKEEASVDYRRQRKTEWKRRQRVSK